MNGAMYLASSGAMLNQQRLEILSNNLANITTTGFKRQTTAFRVIDSPEEIRQAMQDFSLGAGITTMPIWQRMETRLDFSQGQIKKTGNRFDFALSGKGFFCVQAPDGVRYTRKGNFTLNEDKELVTAEGHTVLADGGSIRIDSNRFHVDGEGYITVDGESIGKLRIVEFDNQRSFRRTGSSLFAASDLAGAAKDAESVQVRQGYLESSNVEAVKTMVDMIETLRSYEAYQKTIRALDESKSKGLNELGRVG